MPPKLTTEIIVAAIEGFEGHKKRIDAQIAELRALLTGGPTETAATPETEVTRKPKPKRKLSKAGRAAIVAATKKRWAAIHESATSVKEGAPKEEAVTRTESGIGCESGKARAAQAAKRAAA